MSALPKAAEIPSPWWSQIEFPWAETARRAPMMVATMASYLDQLGVSARPMTVAAVEGTLRHFAGQVTESDPNCTAMALVERRHIEAHKLWLAARPGKAGKPLATVTIRHRLGLLRTFLERLRDWDYDDAPTKTLIFPATSHRPTSRCRSSSTTRRWRSSPLHWRATPILADGSWSRSWRRPASGWASCRGSTTRP